MFARLTIIQVRIDKIDEATKLYGESVVPAAKGQKGFKGTNLLVDRKTGKGIAVTLWETEEDAIANEENRYYQEQVSKFIPYFTAPVIREGYDVAIQA
ncbi:MAG: antibiotic biosynthesis monooxygenase [Candidatus Aminicenantaceae bacterium]